MYLWHIINRNDSELIHKVYSVQKFQTTRGDWFELAQKTKAILSIDKTDDEIKGMKQETFKSYLEKNIKVAAFQYLQNIAQKHSKSEFFWNKEKLETQKYLYDVRFSKQEIQLLFALRSKMINVKRNFRNLFNNNLECQTCDDKTAIEDETHLLNCKNLKTDESVLINFDDVYGSVDDQLKAVRIFKTVLRRRESILELAENG